ncbi:MAG: thioredoxin reductase [Rhizobacter sp.]|nr:thioredoxin reductase [Rhizobacter sp.]
MSAIPASARRKVLIHPVTVRAAHWINAFAMACMLMSGWGIYNASPIFGFRFPAWSTLGGWLGGSIAWHFAAMWLLVINGLVYVVYGLLSGHFRKQMLPVRPIEVAQEVSLALRFKLPHKTGAYNSVQRLLYLGVAVLAALVIVSGLSIWKPVQLDWLVDLFGGFDTARTVHFVAMAGIGAFIVVHLALVALVPKTLLPMFTGRAKVHVEEGRP